MKVLLHSIDSKKPNLALEKIAKHHRDRGDVVLWNYPLYNSIADTIYVSCIFDWNKSLCDDFKSFYPDKVICGGSGYNLFKNLPAEIDKVKPRINWGFTTRGCIRACPWCIVPKKEGGIKAVGDLLDLWDGKARKITLLDNNILALPEHFINICKQAKEYKLKLDFNQGLDARLLTDELACYLSSISHDEYKFAFDTPNMKDVVVRAIRTLRKHNIKRSTWFVLVGFGTTFQQDIDRLNYLRGNDQNACVMRYNYCKDRKYIALAQWANQHNIFHGMTFRQFLNHPDRGEHKSVLVELKDKL